MAPHDPYLDPTTGILKNKLGLTEQAALSRAEAAFSLIRMDELRENPLPGQFDLTHLTAIHHHIFDDVYFMAGEVRVIGIEKDGGVNYPHPDHPHPDGNLHRRLDYTFQQLHKDLARQADWIDNLEHLGKRLAKHIGEIWECHPFREGNTRTCAEFVYQLAGSLERPLARDFPDNPAHFRRACVDTALMRSAPLAQLLTDSLHKHKEHTQTSDRDQLMKRWQQIDAQLSGLPTRSTAATDHARRTLHQQLDKTLQSLQNDKRIDAQLSEPERQRVQRARDNLAAERSRSLGHSREIE